MTVTHYQGCIRSAKALAKKFMVNTIYPQLTEANTQRVIEYLESNGILASKKEALSIVQKAEREYMGVSK